MKAIATIAKVLLISALGFAPVGCETDSALSSVYITPSSATIRTGQSRVFTASGGYSYVWNLEEDDGGDVWATLSTRRGPRTTYTSIRDSGSNATVRVLTVTSTVEGAAAGSSSTNGTVTTQTSVGRAYITHR